MGEAPGREPAPGGARRLMGRDTAVPAPAARAVAWLQEPVDAAALAALRILLGFVIAGVLACYGLEMIPEYAAQSLHLRHYGFGWIPDPGRGLHVVLGVSILAALCAAVGLFFRAAGTVLAVGLAWLLLLDATQYSSTVYLALLTAVLLPWLPAQRIWSVDARRAGGAAGAVVPRWTQLAVAAIFGVVLFHSGLARLGPDWLQGYPLRLWLAGRADVPLVGRQFFAEPVALGWSWVWAVLPLAAFPLLFWRRTRLAAYILVVALLVANAIVLREAAYALMMGVGLLATFSPDWPRRVLRLAPQPATSGSAKPPSRASLAIIAGVLAFHALFPLRAALYPGDAAWTEEGQLFAWRHDLRMKMCRADYRVRDLERGATWKVPPQDHLTPAQMTAGLGHPDLLLQVARHLATSWEATYGPGRREVTGTVRCSLNGRNYALLADPALDLSGVDRGLGHADWVLPLNPAQKPLGTFPVRQRLYTE